MDYDHFAATIRDFLIRLREEEISEELGSKGDYMEFTVRPFSVPEHIQNIVCMDSRGLVVTATALEGLTGAGKRAVAIFSKESNGSDWIVFLVGFNNTFVQKQILLSLSIGNENLRIIQGIPTSLIPISNPDYNPDPRLREFFNAMYNEVGDGTSIGTPWNSMEIPND